MPQDKKFRARLFILLALLSLWSGAIFLRLIYLQILQHDHYQKEAAARQEAVQNLEPRRGTIYDRNGRALTISVEVTSLVVNPQVIKDPADTLAKFARVLPFNLYETSKNFYDRKQSDRKFFFIKRKITPLEKNRILELDIKGVVPCVGKTREECLRKGHMEKHFLEAGISFENEFKRFYPKGFLASHLIGTSNIDQKGLDGVESRYDSFLKGEPINLQVTKDAAGNAFPVEDAVENRRESHLVLTIDEVIQHIAEKELQRAFEETNAYKGCVIVMDPSTGEILALANRPTFSLNNISDYPRENRKNIAITDLYEPGSTFKIIGLSALVEEKKFHPAEVIFCGNGSIRVAGISISDHHPYSDLSALKVIEHSSNVGMIKLTSKLSRDAFFRYITGFGFGEKTGIDLPGEESGASLVRPPSRWSKISQASLSIGQEIGVTSIQMTAAFAAIANGGLMVQPHVAKGYIDPSGTYTPFKRFRQKKVLTEKGARMVTGVLEGVVLNGTGKKAAVPGYVVAGKTGTAQLFDFNLRLFRNDRFVASFIGYAPSYDPALICLVMLDVPRGKAYYGGDVAAPVFSRIVGEALTYLQIPPNRETFSPDQFQREPRKDAEEEKSSPLIPANLLLVKNSAGRSPANLGRFDRISRSDDLLPVDMDDGSMPDLSGRSLRDAITFLSTKGCKVKASGKGYVAAQYPPAGSPLKKDDTCYLELAETLPAKEEAAEEEGGKRRSN